jgi:hypothetical protein
MLLVGAPFTSSPIRTDPAAGAWQISLAPVSRTAFSHE